jgi:dihydrofolate reductase
MAGVIAGMTVSLDGFVNDRNGSPSPLYTDFAELRDSDYMTETAAETGAVLMGRRMFDLGEPDSWGDYEFQVPIFVVTHHPPATVPTVDGPLTFTFVTDGVESAVKAARAAAADKTVQVVGGPTLINQLFRAGLVDELHLDVMPVLLGSGQRFFDDIEVPLEKFAVQEIGVRTGLRFRVTR